MEIRANAGKIKKIRVDLSENRLNSGNFITILHKKSDKLSTAPPPLPGKHQPRTPMGITVLLYTQDLGMVENAGMGTG